jgi:hypothetical protein
MIVETLLWGGDRREVIAVRVGVGDLCVTHPRSGRFGVPCGDLSVEVAGAGPAHLAGLIRSLSARSA